MASTSDRGLTMAIALPGGSPLPRLHHHDIMNCGVILHIRTVRYNTSYVPFVTIRCICWCINNSAVHCSCQQCLAGEWSGRSVTVRARARAREWDFSFLFLSVLKCYKTTLAWHSVITRQ